MGIFSPTNRIDCVLPAGTALFLPVLNVDCSSVEAPPFFESNGGGATRLRDRAVRSDIEDIAAAVNGREVPNPLRFRVVSPQFSIAPAASGADPARGGSREHRDRRRRWRLPHGEAVEFVGDHTIHITGTFTDLGFSLDATIEIVVLPRK